MSTDIQRVRRLGKSYAHPLVVLIARRREDEENSRIAVIAGRSIGNAVRRNRAKRLLRAAMHPHLCSLPPGWDLVLVARKPISQVSFDETKQALNELIARARLNQEMHEKGPDRGE